MHRILLEDGYKSLVEVQRSTEKAESYDEGSHKKRTSKVVGCLDHLPYFHPVQVVPKKCGMTVVRTENNVLLSSRTVTEWRICIDYRNMNKATL